MRRRPISAVPISRPTASTTPCSTRLATTRSRCTIYPPTSARRSPRGCCTARASASSIRPRTAATPRRRCSSGCSPAPEELASRGSHSVGPHSGDVMPQPKSPTRSGRATAAKKPTATAAKKPAAKRAAAKPAAAAAAKRTAAKPAAKRTAAKPAAKAAPKRTAAKPAAKAKKPAARRTSAAATATASNTTRRSTNQSKKSTAPAKTTPRAKSRGNGASTDDTFVSAVNHVRDILTRGVVLTAERLQDTVDDAVARGRLTNQDADDLASRLINIGRTQAEELREEVDELRGELEELFSEGPFEVLNAGLRAGGQLTPDRIVRELDRFRRVAGVGPSFPILGYDDLTATQVVERLEDLNTAQLRKVRDRERRVAKRKSVLDA